MHYSAEIWEGEGKEGQGERKGEGEGKGEAILCYVYMLKKQQKIFIIDQQIEWYIVHYRQCLSTPPSLLWNSTPFLC